MATVVLVVLALALDGPIAGLEVDALRASDVLAPSTERLLHGLIEWIGLLVVLAVWIGPLALRRYRVFAYVAIAGHGGDA